MPPPGVILLDGADAVESLDPSAEEWLRELPDDGMELPTVVYAVARQARLLAAGASTAPPTARGYTRTGRYVAVRATCLAARDGAFRVAVVLEPPRPQELAPLLTALGELTPREQEITQLLLRGLPTTAIAESLWISRHTLRGHLKAIFDKLRVRSRTELAALLLHHHLNPAAEAGRPPGATALGSESGAPT